nr:helix-turn-helix domain-containing protein [Natronomonas sp. LN261]
MAGGTLAESESVTWLGEAQFTDRRPRVVYTARDAGPPPVTDQGSEPTSPGTPADTGPLVPLVVLAVVVVVGAGSALVYRSDVLRTIRRSGVPIGDTEADSAAVEGTAEPPEPEPEREPAPANENAGQGGEADARHGEFGPVAPAVSDEELRSDDERVISLLEERGGRMKQVDIVANTDWSKSKVSMLLSEMEDEGVISRLRVGRENIVSLAGHEPDAAGSPFESEQ